MFNKLFKYLFIMGLLLFVINCSSNENSNNQEIGYAKIDGVTESGDTYLVNIWQSMDPNRGQVIATLQRNTEIKIFSINIIDDIPWFKIKTNKKYGYVNVLHLKDIHIKSDYMINININYDRIKELSMMSDKLINRKKINTY